MCLCVFVLAGTREGLGVQRSFSVKSLVGVAAPSDLVGSFLVEILHSVEGGDIEQRCSNLEINLPCLRLLSLSLTCVYILLAYIAFIFICLIYTCAKIDICLGLFAHTCIQPREPERRLNSYLEES